MLEILSDPTTGEVVWVLDALDECTDFERKRLLDCLTEIYLCEKFQNNKSIKLKILITSRQYHDIEVRFRRLTGKAGYIQLDGDERSEEISQEINLVIKDAVPRVASSLSENDQAKVIEHLGSIPHRTYLWLHLMLQEIEHKVVAYSTERRLASIIRKLPTSVYDAYERILERSADRESARKILQIVIATKRALTVSEMNVALALALQGRCSSYDELDRPTDKEFKSSVKQICGRFVSITDQKVYLLHQTAREFLICQPGLASQGWQHSLSLESGHSLLFRICVYLLSFSEFESPPWAVSNFLIVKKFRSGIKVHVLLRYAAEAWVEHYHQMQERTDNDLIEIGMELCNTALKKSVTWRAICNNFDDPGGSIHVACMIGWYAVVERMLDDGIDVNLRVYDSEECPLHYAARSAKNLSVVKLLLDRGADVNAKDKFRMRPLHRACEEGDIRSTRLLLNRGANVDAISDYGTALCLACGVGNEDVVQLLLGRGANFNLGDLGNRLTYFPACQRGRRTIAPIAQQLINRGADINVVNSAYGTPLNAACSKGDEAIVRLLLQQGVDIKAARGIDVATPLIVACSSGNESIVRLLLESEAEASEGVLCNSQDKMTPLHVAAWNGSVEVAQLLIDHGVDVNTQDDSVGTPLVLAAYAGHYSMVEFLLDTGADVLATCDYFVNALVAATQGKHRRIFQLLLSRGARFHKSDWEGLRDWHGEGYLLKLDSVYEQVKDQDMQKTIEVLLAAKGLISDRAEDISKYIRSRST